MELNFNDYYVCVKASHFIRQLTQAMMMMIGHVMGFFWRSTKGLNHHPLTSEEDYASNYRGPGTKHFVELLAVFNHHMNHHHLGQLPDEV